MYVRPAVLWAYTQSDSPVGITDAASARVGAFTSKYLMRGIYWELISPTF